MKCAGGPLQGAAGVAGTRVRPVGVCSRTPCDRHRPDRGTRALEYRTTASDSHTLILIVITDSDYKQIEIRSRHHSGLDIHNEN